MMIDGFDHAQLWDLANADIGLPSTLAQSYLDGSDLSEKQLAEIERGLSMANDCSVCGRYAGFDNSVCEDHETRDMHD